VLGSLGQLRHVLQGLAQRRRGQRESLVVFEMSAELAVMIVFVGRRSGGGVLGLDVLGVLEPRPVGNPSTSMMPE